jgi:ABC-type transporter Mla MlaB component
VVTFHNLAGSQCTSGFLKFQLNHDVTFKRELGPKFAQAICQREDFKTMLRITKILEDENTIRLSLDGRVDGSSMAELEASVVQYRNGGGKSVTLDFAGVLFIDEAGLKLLQKIKDHRITIINCSLFVKTLLGDLFHDRGDE